MNQVQRNKRSDRLTIPSEYSVLGILAPLNTYKVPRNLSSILRSCMFPLSVSVGTVRWTVHILSDCWSTGSWFAFPRVLGHRALSQGGRRIHSSWWFEIDWVGDVIVNVCVGTDTLIFFRMDDRLYNISVRYSLWLHRMPMINAVSFRRLKLAVILCTPVQSPVGQGALYNYR